MCLRHTTAVESLESVVQQCRKVGSYVGSSFVGEVVNVGELVDK